MPEEKGLTLDELYKNWQRYAWEWRHRGKLYRIVLKEMYCKCELNKVGKRKVPALVLHNRYDDGSWANELTILRCNKDGNCYQFTCSVRNILKYRWRKCGKFVKLSATSK